MFEDTRSEDFSETAPQSEPAVISQFERIPEAVRSALEGRGFTALTPVQEAVLNPALEGRDLRIASQTGSGKTVAVGLVLAPMVEAWLEERASSGPLPRGEASRPAALVIAPTRELAAQLGRELSWLLESLSARVAVVAGGGSYPREFAALREQPAVVVGTPGRVIDHITRGSLDPSAVRAAVLDEADQMLDLGFRDELESILGATPTERRTLLVSATFSREVLSLARRYQRDAVLVEGTALGDANGDITHIAHVVRDSDRQAAIINLLLMARDERTLLFVRTRADASEIAQGLMSLGFAALPISGDLEQRERNKTLEAFRSGAIQTLVATDVAARGIDVPDVTQVIHVDPPTDVEGLTHRSGRTGRAGRKGTSVVLIAPSQRERVATLFRRARVEVEWRPVPSPEDIRRAADVRLVAELSAAGEGPADPARRERFRALAAQLLESADPEALVAALLERTQHVGPCEPRPVTPIEPRPPRAAAGGPGAGPRERRPRGRAFVPFRVSWGESSGADAPRILAMVCRRGKIRGDQVGAIRIGEDSSIVEIAEASAPDFSRAVRRPDPRHPKMRIDALVARPSAPRRSGAERR